MKLNDILRIEDLSNVKMRFTSMLSGQRALDNGSKERLVWHVNALVNN
jgi:hypothetical protein